MTHDPLLYGKAGIDRIVGIEVKDNSVELFRLKEDYSIESIFKPFKYWILSSEKEGKGWARLDGDLHYKWGKQFDTAKDFYSIRSYLKRKEIYSVYDPKESTMLKDGYAYYLGLKPAEIPIHSFDLETTSLDPFQPAAKVLLISNTFRRNGVITRKLFAYDDYKSEEEMILAWVDWTVKQDASIIVGHNIFGFDFNYLLGRAAVLGIELNLGRDGSSLKQEDYISNFRVDGSRDLHYKKVKCYGRELIDTMFLAYRYDIATKKYDSYGLKAIIKTEGIEKTDRVMYDASQIRFNYLIVSEWSKIKLYCEHDADDALSLFDLMSPSYFYMTQSIPRSFQQVHTSAPGAHINGMMIRSYLQQKHSLPKADVSVEYTGAISIGNPGIYNEVHKIDVASLYPSIMIEYEVFDEDKDPNKHFSHFVRTFTDLRLEYKKKAKEDKYFDDLQSSFKILINSCYGFLGTPGLLFNAPVCASFITQKGREILNLAIDWANKKGYTLVNADTDSISYCSGSKITVEERKKNLDEINSLFPKRISFEDDGYFSSVVVLKAKNYILQYENGKVKMKGSAIKATLKELALREFINKTIDLILNKSNAYKELYDSYVTEIVDVKDITRWTSKKTITDKVINAKRTNEQKVKDIIEGTEYTEGDKLRIYFKPDGTLGLQENFNGDYCKKRLLKKLYDTSQVFESVLPVDELFKNYSLKRNEKELQLFI